VFKGLHNRLGEDGETLTVLSLVSPAGSAETVSDVEGSVDDISQHLRHLAGDDDLVDMYSVVPVAGGTSLEFLALELVPLRQAIEELRRITGDGDTKMSRFNVAEEAEDADAQSGAVSQAVTRLKDALRSLHNRAGEDGQQLTLLSLLSHPSRK
jgi:hypothetical protein